MRRKSWTFAGSDSGGHPVPAIYLLIEMKKLNNVDAKAVLADVLDGTIDADTLIGRSGDDLLNGGLGNDKRQRYAAWRRR